MDSFNSAESLAATMLDRQFQAVITRKSVEHASIAFENCQVPATYASNTLPLEVIRIEINKAMEFITSHWNKWNAFKITMKAIESMSLDHPDFNVTVSERILHDPTFVSASSHIRKQIANVIRYNMMRQIKLSFEDSHYVLSNQRYLYTTFFSNLAYLLVIAKKKGNQAEVCREILKGASMLYAMVENLVNKHEEDATKSAVGVNRTAI
jgi:hypothetical protein